MSTPFSQDHWRTTLRRERAKLPKEALATAAQSLLAQFNALSDRPKTGQKVSGYIAIRGEMDVMPILQQLHQIGCHVYLPILEGENMYFAPWHPDIEIEKKGMGLLEPVHDLNERIEGAELDWVLSPLVGFDAQGNRIGQGGGFYDRTFAFKQKSPEQSPKLIGIAHELQHLEAIESNPWDVRLDAILTENKSYIVNTALVA